MILSKEKTQVLISSHFLYYPFDNTGTSVNLAKFLIPRVKKLVHIEHPFPESDHQYSYLIIYKNGKKITRKRIYTFTKPSWLKYIYDFLLTQIFTVISFTRFDLTIACENLSFISLWPFRKIGVIKKVIYYSVDFVPQRFHNRLLNNLYHSIDKFSCQNSDCNWVVTKRQIRARVVSRKDGKIIPFKIVPIGYRDKEVRFLPLKKIKINQIVYCGGFRKITGPMLILDALPLIIKKYPNIKLLMIGGGPEEKALKEKVINLRIKKYVKFIKFITNHKRLTKALASSAIGLAPYIPDPKSWSNFSDPSKLKLYLACGLPIITTSVTTLSSKIRKKKAGIVINYNPKSLSEAVIRLLKNKKLLNQYRLSARMLSEDYDADQIFNKALATYRII